MIQNIVFDMGNVLILYDAKRYIKKLAKNEADTALLLEELFGSIEWLQMDRGIMENGEAITSICTRLPAHLHLDVQNLITNWHSDIPAFPEMESLAQELKQNGYTLYLLSNTSKKFHTFRKKIPALHYFSGEFISADHQLLKPDLAIYKAFYSHFNLHPSSCFFIDDAVSNIEGAIATGMQGFIFRKNIIALRCALISAGINVASK